MSLQTLKNTLSIHNSLNTGIGVGLTAMDYSRRIKEGQGQVPAAVSSFASNLLPHLLFSGPRAWVYEALYYTAPVIPSLMSAAYMKGRSQQVYNRKSALPFSEHGFAPSAGAMQAMDRGMSAMGQVKGMSGAHAALASQALRR